MGSNPRSSPPPSLKKLTREDAKNALMGMVTAASRPLLVGVTAVRLGPLWTIEETETLFQELVDEGRIRPISSGERSEFGLYDGYVLAGVDPGK